MDFGGGFGQVVPHVRLLETRLRNKVSITVVDGTKSIKAGKEILV